MDRALVLQLTKVVFKLVFRIFWQAWHPCYPWGHVNNREIIVLRFLFDILVPQCPQAIFFSFFLNWSLYWFNIYLQSQHHFFEPQWLNSYSGTSCECSNMKQITAGSLFFLLKALLDLFPYIFSFAEIYFKAKLKLCQNVNSISWGWELEHFEAA